MLTTSDAFRFYNTGEVERATSEGEKFITNVIYEMCAVRCLGIEKDIISDFLKNYIETGDSGIDDEMDLDVIITRTFNDFLRYHLDDLIDTIANTKGYAGIALAQDMMKEVVSR